MPDQDGCTPQVCLFHPKENWPLGHEVGVGWEMCLLEFSGYLVSSGHFCHVGKWQWQETYSNHGPSLASPTVGPHAPPSPS